MRYPLLYVPNFFLFINTQATLIYTLSLHDALPILSDERKMEFYKLYIPQLYRRGEISEEVYEGMKEDIFGEGKAEGGIMDLGGKEMDMRTGGFIDRKSVV